MMIRWRRPAFWLGTCAAAACWPLLAPALLARAGPPDRTETRPRANLRFEISFSTQASAEAVDGRVYLCISTDGAREPRFEINERANASQQLFGVDADGLAPGAAAVIDGATLGYPLAHLGDLPRGDYYVQALLNRYTTFHRSDGYTLKLPMDEGEGQRWNAKPGNFYSAPRRLHIDPAESSVIRIEMAQVIPSIQPPRDTPYVKHLRFQSEVLSRFWGRPMYLGAIVLLPAGWDAHPDARYPLLVEQGHFQADIRGFSSEPPPPNLSGFAAEAAKAAYQFYQDWTSGRLPRMIILVIQHANPYYDDSYAVDSANVGPYGDAINRELIPYVESKYRGIGQGWARATFGGSTGGWEALASQVFYPDFYNGTWAFCPDPVDFHSYQIVNLYDDRNALWLEGPMARVPRPDMRETDGTVLTTMEQSNRYELVLGTHGRSTEQWDIWQAVFSPVGPDGYPQPIWDPYTGVIDHSVSAYWSQHYDLDAILQRNWKTLGPALAGKIHVTVGTRDTYYLDLAVRRLQKFLESTKGPYYAGSFEYGPGQPHCFTGEADLPARVGSLTATERVLKAAAARMLQSAPPGADIRWGR
ncbi:MAG TPA: alpha/beta hydrolase-fold protein [Candidatus Acidoferrales bacterium]|nr:alpha/beta hydrolase-fold protein [Candidatus Acidoferrales bacterium]